IRPMIDPGGCWMNDPSEIGTTIATYVYEVRLPPSVRFEHDPAGRVFRLTGADGTVEVFRDSPVRYLRVEPDPDAGAMRPVIKHGRPEYVWLCREELERR
ncbi:MAG: hypothetical protein ACYC61_30270, partial [Isosphaeraceae bacterium]